MVIGAQSQLMISISGPPRSGKTTLWRTLKQALGEEACFLPDLPREALSTIGLDLPERDLEAFQHFIGYGQLIAEAKALSVASSYGMSTSPVVCDKSVLDALAYWNVLIGGRRPLWAHELERPRYTLVAICDHNEIVSIPDALEALHESVRHQLSQAIIEVSRTIPTRVIHVSGTPEQRADRVLAAIRGSRTKGFA